MPSSGKDIAIYHNHELTAIVVASPGPHGSGPANCQSWIGGAHRSDPFPAELLAASEGGESYCLQLCTRR